jgi:hypothetical protein
VARDARTRRAAMANPGRTHPHHHPHPVPHRLAHHHVTGHRQAAHSGGQRAPRRAAGASRRRRGSNGSRCRSDGPPKTSFSTRSRGRPSGSAAPGSVAGRSKSGPSSSCASVTTWPTWTTTANDRGAGAVGGCAIQLAKTDDLSVLAGRRSADDKLVRSRHRHGGRPMEGRRRPDPQRAAQWGRLIRQVCSHH